MKTKFLFLLIAIIIIYCDSTSAQYQIIYNVPADRQINTIAGYDNIYNQDCAFYISIGGNWVTSAPPYWNRWNMNSNSFNDNPHSAFLQGSTCYDGLGGFAWSSIGCFLRGRNDTNFLLARMDWTDCTESGYRNFISYNSGITKINLNPIGLYSFDVDPVNENIVYGAGGDYLMPVKFWKTTNKGLNWTGIDLNGDGGNKKFSVRINPLNYNEIVIAGSKLWKSSDGGSSLNQISVLPANSNFLYFNPVNGSMFISNIYGVYKSTNGGLSFFQCLNVNCNVLLINPDNHNIVYAGTNEGLYRSVNGGNNWTLYANSFGNSLNITGLVKCKNDGDTIYVSNNASVYKIWESLVNINSESNISPTQFSLSQNYPNPFNPSTVINYELRVTSYVLLKVYDVLGNEIATLVNEKQNAGSYNYQFSTVNYQLPSGIYFYKLEAGDFTETKRMVLLK